MHGQIHILTGWVLLLALAPELPGIFNSKPPETTEVMERLHRYAGTWKSDAKVNRRGEELYYTYKLDNYADSGSIMKMVIERHYMDGRMAELIWEGFKGWNPAAETTYYYGFSPSGRFAKGTVFPFDDKLITEYTGYGTDGNPVMLRDEFSEIEDDVFRSVTMIKSKAGNWKEISRDTWTKQ